MNIEKIETTLGGILAFMFFIIFANMHDYSNPEASIIGTIILSALGGLVTVGFIAAATTKFLPLFAPIAILGILSFTPWFFQSLKEILVHFFAAGMAS